MEACFHMGKQKGNCDFQEEKSELRDINSQLQENSPNCEIKK